MSSFINKECIYLFIYLFIGLPLKIARLLHQRSDNDTKNRFFVLKRAQKKAADKQSNTNTFNKTFGLDLSSSGNFQMTSQVDLNSYSDEYSVGNTSLSSYGVGNTSLSSYGGFQSHSSQIYCNSTSQSIYNKTFSIVL